METMWNGADILFYIFSLTGSSGNRSTLRPCFVSSRPLDPEPGWTSRSNPPSPFYTFLVIMLPSLVMVLRLWNGELEFVSVSFGCLCPCTALFRISGMSHLILDFFLFLSI
ncbi:hypothetical protein BJX76DRAFT_101448 [Aspergillus varians]